MRCGKARPDKTCPPPDTLNTETRGLEMAKEIQCAFGVDIDAVAGWLGSYGGEIRRLTFSAACSLVKSARRAC